MNKYYRYPLKFKLPGHIASFLLGFLVPVGFIFLALFSLFESSDWIALSNIETDGLGIIVALLIGTPLFIFISLLNLYIFPEIEIEDNKFRLITRISKSNWMKVNKIQDLDDATINGLKRLGNLTIVQVHDLPFIFGLITLIYRLEHPSIFIHPKIQHFEELFTILKGKD